MKALEIAARRRIAFAGGVWLVPAQGSPGTEYRVTIGDEPSCECDDSQLR